MEAYLRRLVLEANKCMEIMLFVELKDRVEQLATTGNGRHQCFITGEPSYCRVGLVEYYATVYQELLTDLMIASNVNHYETLLYNQMRLSGLTHETARVYADIRRLRDFLLENFVGLFNALWERHPEQMNTFSAQDPLVEVQIEVVPGSMEVTDDVIEIDNV